MADMLPLLFLIVLNSLFSMAEIAVVSSRITRLKRMADERNNGAQSEKLRWPICSLHGWKNFR